MFMRHPYVCCQSTPFGQVRHVFAVKEVQGNNCQCSNDAEQQLWQCIIALDSNSYTDATCVADMQILLAEALL